MNHYSIERIPRLTFNVCVEIIRRQQIEPARVCCYRCESPLMVGIPFRGRVLCETCEQFERLRAYPARLRAMELGAFR